MNRDNSNSEAELIRVGKLNVFISYSREDLEFADQLDEVLQLTGFATTIDRHGISGGEDWKNRLGSLIRDADTIVFILSPSSAKSEICAWEVSQALHLNKRIIPVVNRSLDGQSPPQQLVELNYIFFYREEKLPGSGFGNGLSRLVHALNTDHDWLREHTRLLQRATEWVAGERAANRLLSGGDIAAAKTWAAKRPKGAPEPTSLHLEFLRASETEEDSRKSTERSRLEQIAAAQAEKALALEEQEIAARKLSRRTAFGLAGATSLTAVSAGLAYWGVDAEGRFRREQERAAGAKQAAQEEAVLSQALRTDVTGTLMVYATQRGRTASDELTASGLDPFTDALLSALSDPNTSIEQAIRVTRSTLERSHIRQRPYVTTDMGAELYLQINPGSRQLFAISIGNDAYKPQLGALRSCRNCSSAWSAFIRRCGFKDTLLHDASRSEILAAIRSVKEQLDTLELRQDGDQQRKLIGGRTKGFVPIQENLAPRNALCVFFYSGHAASISGRDILIPVDAEISASPQDVSSSIPVEEVVAEISRPDIASIFIFDSCSNELSLPSK